MAHLGMSGQVRKVREAGTLITSVAGGYRSRYAMWVIGYDQKPHAVIKGYLLRQELYDGMVYCLTVPNGTLFTRRKGIAMWSGNCISEVVHHLIGSQITALREELSNLGVRGMGPTGMGGERVMATGVPNPRDPATALGELGGGRAARGAGTVMPSARGRGRAGGKQGWGRR